MPSFATSSSEAVLHKGKKTERLWRINISLSYARTVSKQMFCVLCVSGGVSGGGVGWGGVIHKRMLNNLVTMNVRDGLCSMS